MDERAIEQNPTVMVKSEPMPNFLKAWIGLQLISFVVGPILDPVNGMSWGRLLGWILIAAALAYGLACHSRAAWVIALLFAGLSLLGGLRVFTGLVEGLDRESVWEAWGLLFGVADLAILLSPQAKAWIKEPTVRRWDP